MRVWDKASGKLYHTYSGHFEEVTSLALVGNGEESVVSASIDGTIRTWDLGTAALAEAKEKAETDVGKNDEEEKQATIEENPLTEEEERELAELMGED